MNATNIVLDTSIIIKWLLPDEEEKKALKLKQDFDQKIVTVALPHLTYYEIGNVLKTAMKRERISKDSAKKLYSAFTDLEFVVYATKNLFTLALSKSLDFDISFYDASYIALSEYLQCPFITADQKLLKKVQSDLIIDLQSFAE